MSTRGWEATGGADDGWYLLSRCSTSCRRLGDRLECAGGRQLMIEDARTESREVMRFSRLDEGFES